jgi:hypothetical protein
LRDPGNAWAAGEADLRFQDTLAGSTAMRRIPQLFYGLTAQLRMFIAVMGLDYTYSIPGMCRDDTILLDRIRARDEAGAARGWHRKIDDAAAYMTTRLAIPGRGVADYAGSCVRLPRGAGRPAGSVKAWRKRWSAVSLSPEANASSPTTPA